MLRAGVAVDGATPDGGRGEDARLFQHSQEKQEAGSRRWTCVAARPLGAEIAGAQDVPLDPKLPRDLHGELKKPTHGFLADRGTVTVAPNERALISVLLARLQRDDPDVLCGHNILGPYLGVPLSLSDEVGAGLCFDFEPFRITRSPRCEHFRERAIITGRGDGV